MITVMEKNLSTLNKKRLYHVILPLFIGSVIAYLDRINIAYAALTMNRELGFSASIFGMGAGIFFAGYVLFEIPGALIAERWSPRIWLARIMITWGMVSVFMAFIRTPWQFYLVRFLLGAAEASFYPIAYASVIPRWYTPEERPRAIALMLASLQVSAIFGSPLAGWLLGFTVVGLHGWQLLFIIEAIPACMFGVLLLFWLVDWPEKAAWLTADEKKYLADSFAHETEAKNKIKRYTVLQAFSSWKVIKLCCIYFLWITGFWGYNYWLPTVLKEASGWSAMTIGWMIVIPMTLALLGMVLVGWSSSRHNEKRWHGAIPMFLAAAGMLGGVCLSDPGLGFAAVCLAGIGVYSAFGVWWSYPTTFLSGAAAAGAIGMINSSGNVGGYVGPFFAGWIKTLTGSFQWAYLFFAVLLTLAGLLMLTLKEERTDNIYT
jgi:MFS transporter, ACS family, tartrate transporter